jgi:DNA-binding transcriptional MerR regulator/methylmalonyl-CoA mutase cobalamin-binding subunit
VAAGCGARHSEPQVTTEPTYRIQMAAEISGVKEGLIRAWERRYGVLKPARSPGGYRTYTQADIEVLKRLKRLTEEGVAIAEAVKLLPAIRREAREVEEPTAPRPKLSREEQLKAWREEILAAGQRLDQQQIDAVLAAAIGWLPALVFYDGLVAPLMREVGDRWHAGRLTVAEEHIISQSVRSHLLALWSKAPRRAKHHVVCVCLGEEQHELGLLGAALRFRHQGYKVTFLGARTPVEQVARLVNAVRPDLIAVSVIIEAGVEEQLTALAAALPAGTKVLIGGHGAEAHRRVIKRLGFAIDGDPQ